MANLTSGQVGAAVGIGVASIAVKGGDWPVMDWRDYTAFAVLGLLLLWLLTPRRVRADAHESAGNGIAFRFGKALNRIFRRRNR